MCGIAGFVGDYDRDLLKRMNRTMTHRGPDDEGYFVERGVGLAMRRLSIIDVKSGQQPISNEDKTVWTVFNGEIYNFQELRDTLTQKGHRFKTDHSDTETIVHAYEEYGVDFAKQLNGMFAIAIWDMRQRRLLLYRDRMGEKPLYYWQTKHDFFFCSEIKGLLTLPFFKKVLNERALFYYLGFKNAPRQHCFFQGIESLAPGELLIFQNGMIQKSFYWEIDASETLNIDENEAVHEIRSILKDSVRYRMISDVPLGAYLSGGVDSSAVVGHMSAIRKSPVETFSLTYSDNLPNKEQDQLWAFRMSKKFSTKHREYCMNGEEFANDLEAIIQSFDQPFGGTISTYFLTKLIQKRVKVAVSGDGADELFGSYKAHRLAYPMMYLNQLVRRGVNPRTLTAKQKAQLVPFDQDIDFLLRIQGAEPYQWHANLGAYSDEEKKRVLAQEVVKKIKGESTQDYYRQAYARAKSTDVLNQVLQVECQNLLPDQVLSFVDHLSMAHSVEVRPPFLDHRLVEFVFRLPGWMKINQGMTKYILKKAVGDLLPQELIDRPKEGFILPYHFWMQKYMYDKIKNVLGPSQLKKHGCFDLGYVANLLSSYKRGSLEHSNRIYLLFMFQIWWNKYFQ